MYDVRVIKLQVNIGIRSFNTRFGSFSCFFFCENDNSNQERIVGYFNMSERVEDFEDFPDDTCDDDDESEDFLGHKNSDYESTENDFLKKLFEMVEQENWWKRMLDFSQKDPIHDENADVELIHGDQIEISSTDNISYIEKDGVDFGLVPSLASQPSVGFMRFKGGASKAKEPSRDEVELHVLKGEFLIECDDTTMDAFAGCDVTVPKGVSYGLKNVSDDIGIIQCTYAALSMS
ncbi:uncharacterized protein LOC116344654 [Contarinia nasturtii]|uniref:uncharacterized protein LOC116344654 n=1 Tax=Contarinia nasturtii TaxID=265458 RepID=UPI0012D49222|nr:uncharacterized protein LOC116344654 [Contarinia nasturtii]